MPWRNHGLSIFVAQSGRAHGAPRVIWRVVSPPAATPPQSPFPPPEAGRLQPKTSATRALAGHSQTVSGTVAAVADF